MSDRENLRSEWQAMSTWLNELAKGEVCPFRFPDVSQVAADLELVDIDLPVSVSAPTSFPTSEPALKNVDASVLKALQYALHLDPDDTQLAVWSEKLLLVGELRRLELRKRSRRNSETVADGRLKILWLCLFFLEYFQARQDPRYVNLVLKILAQRWLRADLPRQDWANASTPSAWEDVIVVLVHGLLEHALHTIRHDDWRTDVRFSSDDLLEPRPQLPMKRMFEGDDAPGVIVFSPSPYSLFTLSVLELLTIHGVRVQGIAVRRLVNPQRFIQELKRDGARLVRKVWRNLVLRNKTLRPRAYQTQREYLRELGFTHKHVNGWAKQHEVPIWRCNTLNDVNVLDALKNNQPDAVVFTGGGLIREPVLQASGAGVINTHMGLLPPYRGMDVVEWPILEGRPDQVGLTVHFMAKGLDEGDVLVMHHALRVDTFDIGQLRERMGPLTPQACVNATLRFLAGDLTARPQVITDGKQYFKMHPSLKEIALERYERFQADSA